MSNLYLSVFGNENAENDHFLRDCYVAPPGASAGKPILVGRWGTGKTGHLLHTNQKLEEALVAKDSSLRRIWYLDETAIDTHSLFQLEEYAHGNTGALKRTIEGIWEAEILRAFIHILVTLDEEYGRQTLPCWATVRSAAKKLDIGNTLWRFLPSASEFLVGKERANIIDQFIQSISSINTPEIKSAIAACIKTIPDSAPYPAVAIEPIETPDSPLEGNVNLAQLLVTCLFNVWLRSFQPSHNQPLKVQLSIPWHRFKIDAVGTPHKLNPYIAGFQWDEATLREFINLRIQREFQNAGRSFAKKGNQDAWNALFGSMVTNNTAGIREDTFQYVLRHSQYRVRDIIRFARQIVEVEATSNYDGDTKKVLAGNIPGGRVSEKAIRGAVRGTSRRTAGDRVMEAQRRFVNAEDCVNLLRGISIPFDGAHLSRRHRASRVSDLNFNDLVEVLWNSGIIGFELSASDQVSINQLIASFGRGALSSHQGLKKRFFLFEHNCNNRLSDILSTYGSENDGEVSARYVVHPMMFEFLNARVSAGFPIGR